MTIRISDNTLARKNCNEISGRQLKIPLTRAGDVIQRNVASNQYQNTDLPTNSSL
jgi:hypothetical protein